MQKWGDADLRFCLRFWPWEQDWRFGALTPGWGLSSWRAHFHLTNDLTWVLKHKLVCSFSLWLWPPAPVCFWNLGVLAGWSELAMHTNSQRAFWRVRLPHTSPHMQPKYTKVKVPSTQDKQYVSWVALQMLLLLLPYKRPCHSNLPKYVATHSHQTDYLVPLRSRQFHCTSPSFFRIPEKCVEYSDSQNRFP